MRACGNSCVVMHVCGNRELCSDACLWKQLCSDACLSVAGSRKPGSNYNRVELKRDPRRTFRAIHKITKKSGYRKDLSMVGSQAPWWCLVCCRAPLCLAGLLSWTVWLRSGTRHLDDVLSVVVRPFVQLACCLELCGWGGGRGTLMMSCLLSCAPLFGLFWTVWFLRLRSQLYLWGSPFWVRFLRVWPFLNPAIEVVTFRLRGWRMLGVFLLPAFTRLGYECQDLLSLCSGMHVSTD